MFVQLIVRPKRPLYPTPSERLAFARRAATECTGWGLELAAWRLLEHEALLLVRGQATDARRFASLLVAHHAAHTMRGPNHSDRLARVVPDVERAWQVVGQLHGRGGALRDPWSSLWDGLGLRTATWFQPTFLRSAPPGVLLEAVGWRGRHPGKPPNTPPRVVPGLIEGAAALVTGRPRADCARRLIHQTAWCVARTPAPWEGRRHRALAPTLAVVLDPRLHGAASATP